MGVLHKRGGCVSLLASGDWTPDFCSKFSADFTAAMATPLKDTPSHGRIKGELATPSSVDSSYASGESRRLGNDSPSTFPSESHMPSNLLRFVQSKNLQSLVTSETPQVRHTSGGTKR